ncbi:lysophospholipid acyltransferase family protein [Streptomyces sp. NPDC091292]|uniref:lysophospholipid acyltransferase family protein n=1 Tax=Streptomyces sp. NPDC091292 TaxID=3365991 RepID=UPI003801C713
MSRRRIGFWYRLAAVLCKPPLVVLIKRDWRGMENIPPDGGFITAVNHNSHVDPLAYAHFQYNTGRVPRFLAKDGLFRKGFVGAAMRGTGQIPVYRESTDALSAFRAAIAAVERGECVAFYPEGTITRDPDQWPMTGKTGAARVALETRCPVVPVAQWGANLLLPPYAKKPQVLPRKTHHVLAGPPVDLSRFYDREITPDLLKEATEVIMAAITEQLEVLRGQKAPATPYDPRQVRIEQRRRAAAKEKDATSPSSTSGNKSPSGNEPPSRSIPPSGTTPHTTPTSTTVSTGSGDESEGGT